MQSDPASDITPPEPASLATPIDIRSVSLAVIALLACVFVLHWAQDVFIPLLLGVMLSYALWPVVDRLQRWHLPRVLGAAAVLVAVVGGFGSMAYSLRDDATALVESLPKAAQKVGQALRPTRGAPPSAIDKVQQAAAELEQAAKASGAAAPPAARGVTRVQIEQPRLNIQEYLWSGTVGLARFTVQAVVVFALAFFLLSSGDRFRRKLVRIAGPTFARKRVTVQVLDEITGQIQRFLMVQVLTSVLVGLVTWLAMWWLGLERAALWGLLAGVLNMVPYLGAIVTAGGLALVAFLQFGTLGMAALVGGVSMLINTLEGNLLAPWLTGRASRMNPVVIFIGVLAFGWLWGMWGLLLGTPLILAAKSVCDRVDDLKPIGELLGE